MIRLNTEERTLLMTTEERRQHNRKMTEDKWNNIEKRGQNDKDWLCREKTDDSNLKTEDLREKRLKIEEKKTRIWCGIERFKQKDDTPNHLI